MSYKKLFFLSIGFLFFSASLFAQHTNTDSLTLVSKISKLQLKLGTLQNKVEQTTRDKQDAAMQAQKSADENATAAGRLSGDAQNKKLAKQADNKASDARGDSKKARQTADKLDRLNKDILNTQDEIAKEQRKLNQYLTPGVVTPVPAPVPVPTP